MPLLATAFESASRDLREMITEQQIELVVPAHNDLIRGQASAVAAADEELSYFRDLRADVRSRLAAGTSRERVLHESASHMGERRGVDLGPKARQTLLPSGPETSRRPNHPRPSPSPGTQ